MRRWLQFFALLTAASTFAHTPLPHQLVAGDVKGRLSRVLVLERDGGSNGYDGHAYFDPLDRRIETQTQIVTNGVACGWPRILSSFYDPQVEFLELGVWVDFGAPTWKLYGPDSNGRYGGLNGTGGFEGVTPGYSTLNPTVCDARGNVLGSVTNGTGISWTAARPTGYGAVPSYRPLPVGGGGDLVTSAAWRGRAVDITGFVNLGGRHYIPESGIFLGSDPVWNGRDPNYYTFAGGDPINFFDPDGRLGRQWTDYSHQIDVNNPFDFLEAVAYGIGGTALQTAGSIPGAFSQARTDMAAANQEISTYTGAEAALANPLRLMGNFAFGTTALFNDPFNTVPQIPGAIAQLPDRMAGNIYNFASSPSMYGAFNLVEDALAAGGLAYGIARGLTVSGATAPLENFAARAYLNYADPANGASLYNSFVPGTARLNIGFGGETLYRAADNMPAASGGRFASVEMPSSPANAIQRNALAPQFGNTASQLFQVTPRPGFSVEGIAASQGLGFEGGAMQVFQNRPPATVTSPRPSPWASIQQISYPH